MCQLKIKSSIYKMKCFLLFVFMFLSMISLKAQVFPDDAWGVYTWGSYNPNNINPVQTPEVKGVPLTVTWRSLEPKNGEFEFDKMIGEKLVNLANDNYYATLMVWVAFSTKEVSETDTVWAFTPPWLFNSDVPLVEFPPTVNPLGETLTRYFPYYLDENYKYYFHRMIDSLGTYICSLPSELKNRIIFIQSAEGSTGDGKPYKGDPVDSKYNISNEQWSAFRIETWEKYVQAFSTNEELQIPLLTNYDSNEEEQYSWMLNNLPKAIGLKNGMFSHGYHISDAQERLANFIDFRNAVEAQGKVFFARGEQDAEYKTYGWSTQNIPQGLYWSALYATHCGLTLWNVPWEACADSKNKESLRVFNRYAAQTDPRTADYAFCALRRGLDASDTESFPEYAYGEAVKSNVQRYIDIAESYSEYGAKMGDPEKATGGGMINRKREDYNDAGWEILTGNYQRHLTQIEPDETSVAWWGVNKDVYGRFARGFDVSKGMNAMYFDLDDNFFGDNQAKQKSEIKIKVIYFDNDGGSWELLYHAADGTMKKACDVNNLSFMRWVEKTVTINDAMLSNGGEKGADIIIQNTGNTNIRFHLIEVDKSNAVYSQPTTETEGIYKTEAQKFKIHPNPFNDFLILPAELQNSKFEIYDYHGAIIYKSANSNKRRIDTSSWKNGVYIYSAAGNETCTLIKL